MKRKLAQWIADIIPARVLLYVVARVVRIAKHYNPGASATTIGVPEIYNAIITRYNLRNL